MRRLLIELIVPQGYGEAFALAALGAIVIIGQLAL